MEFVAGMCIGSILLAVTSPFWIQLFLILAWGLGFIDMEMHATTPDWLVRLRNRFKRT